MDPGLAQTLAVGAMLAVFALILDRRERARYAELKSEVKSDIDALRSEMRAEFASVRTEIAAARSEMRFELAAIRSDLVQVALAVGVQPRPQTG